ncbi:hypothetical protein GCM10029978_088610 [Actinoallomurus acanthiterrae]
MVGDGRLPLGGPATDAVTVLGHEAILTIRCCKFTGDDAKSGASAERVDDGWVGTTLFVVHHGETVWHDGKRYAGSSCQAKTLPGLKMPAGSRACLIA